MEREKILIDTTVLIDHLRKKDKSGTLFFKTALRFDCCISSITEFEFIVGRNEKNKDFINHLLDTLPVLPFDSTCAKIASDIYCELKLKNCLLPASDLFIAATALAHAIPLATLNQRHFSKIQKVKLFHC